MRRCVGGVELNCLVEVADRGIAVSLKVCESPEGEVGAGIASIRLQNRLLLSDCPLDILVERRLKYFLSPE